jgi:hypothetical protein
MGEGVAVLGVYLIFAAVIIAAFPTVVLPILDATGLAHGGWEAWIYANPGGYILFALFATYFLGMLVIAPIAFSTPESRSRGSGAGDIPSQVTFFAEDGTQFKTQIEAMNYDDLLRQQKRQESWKP